MADKKIIINFRKMECKLSQILPHGVSGCSKSFGCFGDVVAVFLADMFDMEAHGFFKIIGNFYIVLRQESGVQFTMFTDELLVVGDAENVCTLQQVV